MDHLIEVTLAGLTLPCALRFPEAAVFPLPDPAAPRVEIDPVRLTEEDWDYYIRQGSEASPQSEYSLLTAAFSDALMDFDRLVIHGAALRWQDRAWLICGPSGVGKSTQAGWLRRLRPGEFGVISGDRPILSFHDNEIIVHPSPWNGKENWHDAVAAPLAGIVLLRRGEENRLEALDPREAAVPVYAQVIQTAARADRLRRSAELVTALVQAVTVWRLTTHQPPASTELLLNEIFYP